MQQSMKSKILEVKKIIQNAKYLVAFTGAGISVESGIPPYRGKNGIWEKYDPQIFDINYFFQHPEKAWGIKKILLKLMQKAKPNDAHLALAKLENKGILKSIVTQNIDYLHQRAGNKNVLEFHGTMKTATCMNNKCKKQYKTENIDLKEIPPKCKLCGTVLKPDICFFGENPDIEIQKKSFNEAIKCDVMLVIGTTGEVHPARLIPRAAKQDGATIIEINTKNTSLNHDGITDIFLKGKAGEILNKLINS